MSDTTPQELDTILAAAAAAQDAWATSPPAARAAALDEVAAAMGREADRLVALAEEESHLPEARLRGELTRTRFQLGHFAGILREGSFLDATIDHADPDWPPAPRPDLRLAQYGLGPVVVFAGGNFPFAFSVAGGDTASALAAGCPVVLKVHPGHPRLSAATAEIVVAALVEAGAPSGAFAVVYGEQAGREAVVDPRVAAGSFTGSLGGGRALFDLASGRPSPIPFFAEMGSLNPVFVTSAALEADRDALLDGFVGSFTLGVGQFCTKPGMLIAPAGSGIEDALRARVEAVAAAPMLSEGIAGRYGDTLTALRAEPASRDVVVAAAEGVPDGLAAGATLISATAADFLVDRDGLLVECFGPASVLVSYADEEELTAVAQAFDGQLTATLHALADEPLATRLLPLLRRIAGRVLFNDWPTGVAVTAAMQHGGPYPATTAASTTSVGDLAIRRFLRPVSYQGVPDPLLPPALQDANPWGLPRRVDGRLVPSPDQAENEVT